MTEEEFTALLKSRFESIKRLNTEKTNFYDYEKEFAQIWLSLGREILESNLGSAGNDRRKKKDKDDVRSDKDEQE
jgi:hypothetical protein